MAIFNSYVKLPEGTHWSITEDIPPSSGYLTEFPRAPGSRRFQVWTATHRCSLKAAMVRTSKAEERRSSNISSKTMLDKKPNTGITGSFQWYPRCFQWFPMFQNLSTSQNFLTWLDMSCWKKEHILAPFPGKAWRRPMMSWCCSSRIPSPLAAWRRFSRCPTVSGGHFAIVFTNGGPAP